MGKASITDAGKAGQASRIGAAARLSVQQLAGPYQWPLPALLWRGIVQPEPLPLPHHCTKRRLISVAWQRRRERGSAGLHLSYRLTYWVFIGTLSAPFKEVLAKGHAAVEKEDGPHCSSQGACKTSSLSAWGSQWGCPVLA